MSRKLLADEDVCPSCGGTGEEWHWKDDAPGEKAELVGQCATCLGFGTVSKNVGHR